VLKRHSGKSPFLIQHHQFMEHQAVVNENILAAEIQSIYCGNLQMRKYMTTMLAESNGLAAARANNLPQCQRLKVLGDYFIIQQCASLNITVGMKMTRCGHDTKTLLSEKTVFHYTRFRAVFGRMIQFLSKGKRIDGSGRNGRKFFPRFIWRLCILLNVFQTSKTTKFDTSAQFPIHLKELNTSKRIPSTK
jgi:hypothetical protein